jgi:DsbC/DsbD-like thiol-disulfide interchange protein
MKKISLTLAFVIAIIAGAFAQIESPVTWAFTSKKLADKTYEVQMTASIGPGWHLYSQNPGDGPALPTSFKFTKNPLVSNDGKLAEDGKLIKEYDSNLGAVLNFYKAKVVFKKTVKVKTAAATVLNGEVEFMVCNDKKCLPPKSIPFSIKLDGK